MRIKLLSRVACADGNYPAGTTIELNEKQAKHLVENGHAISFEKIETLKDTKSTNVTKPTAKKKR